MSAVLSKLADWTTEVVDSLGYLGVALLVALENLLPPIPSEVVLPFAGFVARDGNAHMVGMIAAATLGSLVGALVLYGIAAWIGPVRIERFLLRYGRWIRLSPADIARSEAWFDRHSNVAVLVCRCVPLVRSLISIPAGFRRMALGRFAAYTTVGSAVWNTAMITAGYTLRSRWHQVEPVLSWAQYAVIAMFVAATGWYVFRSFLAPTDR